ncbi:N-acetylneuraminate synthase family protein [Candidatus Nitrosopumilus sp. SW]|uniref:N-acetylneuraminate synthase family protein n=1 Tax=Candidatus Nitrosopumilus sp. SW TaxID=2508726 RepID=UPI00163AEBCE|nr:N-acetylneuraminate synthase family protein [Candidatus Nitrosopumilus sp. SW]
MSHQSEINIENKIIGADYPCYIIAEIGVNHNGDLTLAKKLIDVAVDAGANAVKFQKRNLQSLYRKEALENPNIESQGFEILLAELKEVELSKEDYFDIVNYCKEKKITFLCTPWDIPSVDFLEQINTPAYKIASGDMTNFPLIKYISKTRKPMIISTGMSKIEEIEKMVNFVKKLEIPFILLHANSTYPSPIESLNVSLIPEYAKKFNVPIGFSDHEIGIIGSLTAANIGAVVIERHITLDKKMKGLDHSSSLEPNEFKELVTMIRLSEKAKGKPIKKMTRAEVLQREVVSKSIVCMSDIDEGEIFSEENIEVKGPEKGLSAQYFFDIIGKKSPRKIQIGEYLLEDDMK